MDESDFLTDLDVTKKFTYDLVELSVLLVGIVGEVFIEIILGDGINDIIVTLATAGLGALWDVVI